MIGVLKHKKAGQMERRGKSAPGRRVNLDKGLQGPGSVAYLESKWPRMAAGGSGRKMGGRLLATGPDLTHETNLSFPLAKSIVSL